jgi:nucleoside-diphosphate kinase
MDSEKTLVMVKPDGIDRKIVGSILTGIECLGLTLELVEMKNLNRQEACDLYHEHAGKWHFERNIDHITSGPVLLIKVTGRKAVEKCRELVENFRKANREMIKLPKNLVHATDHIGKADQELSAVGMVRYAVAV